jgi:hypothetical protein
VIDPIVGYIGTADGNSETAVRSVLHALREVAESTGAAIMLIRHFKKQHDKAIHRGGGSVAWTAACRVQNVVGVDPQDDSRFVLANSKNNLALKPPSLAYRIVGDTVAYEKKRIDASAIEWIGPVDVTADELASPTIVRGRPDKSSDAVQMIQELLEDGPMDSKELASKVMDKLEIGESTFRKACKEADVVRKRIGFSGNGKWSCRIR